MQSRRSLLSSVAVAALVFLTIGSVAAQTTVGSATFGKVITLGGTPSDILLDEGRGYLYLVQSSKNVVAVYDYNAQAVVRTITVGRTPLSAAISMDGALLYVANNASSSLTLIDLNSFSVAQTVTLPAKPQGVEAGADGRAVIATQGTGTGNTQNTLLIFDRTQPLAVSGQSSVLSMSPDGSRFMAGFTLYDTATLAVIAQQNIANAPFPITGAFNVMQNIGGSTFSPDGAAIYSAFNVAPFVQPATRPQASTLLISDPRNLAIKLGIKLPESVVAKMVMTSDGGNAWGLSESGLIYLPLSTLYTYPIIAPETTTVFLANDDCNRGVASMPLKINNIGAGKLTFSVPDTGV